jgi:hypothetical protein
LLTLPKRGRCQTTENGRLCFNSNGGAFNIGNVGGVFSGAFASAAFPPDFSKAMNGFMGKLSAGGFDVKGLKSLLDGMMGLVDKLGSDQGMPAAPVLPRAPLGDSVPNQSPASAKASSAVPATSPPPVKASPDSIISPTAGKGPAPKPYKPGRLVATTVAPGRLIATTVAPGRRSVAVTLAPDSRHRK